MICSIRLFTGNCRLQAFFIEAYQTIPKFGWQCNIETQEKVTPKIFNELIAEQYRQTFPKEYMHLLKTLRESGTLTNKNLERIRAANRARDEKQAMRITFLNVRSYLFKSLVFVIFLYQCSFSLFFAYG
jgi:hypothetical protein